MSQRKRFLAACLAVAILGTAGGLSYVFRDDIGSSENPVEPQASLCSEHGVPENTCPFCQPDLVKTMGQCAEHDVPEALCYQCRPELVAGFKAKHDWCGEHGVPESWCPLCGGCPPAPSSGASSETNGLSEDEAGADVPRINRAPTAACTNDKVAIKLDSAETARQAGLTYEKVERRVVTDTIRCNAEVSYASNRYARVTSRVQSVVHKVEKDLGSKVSAGDTLAILDSVDLGVAKAEFLRLLETKVTTKTKVDRAQSYFDRANRIEVRLAAVDYLKAIDLLAVSRKNVEREQRLMQRQSGSEKALLEAQADLATTQANVNAHRKKLVLFGIFNDVLSKLSWQDVEGLEGRGSTSEQEVLSARIELRTVEGEIEAARKRLETLGLTADEIAQVVEKKETSSLLRLVAPFDGIVVEHAAVMGEFVDTKKVLFGLADTSKMWAMVDVYPDDLARLRTGQHVALAIDGLRGESFHGTLTWISSHVDRKTRTIKVRAEMGNPEGLLLAGMFGTAAITIHDGTEPVVVVPKDAVQWEGCCNVVFIRHTDTLFETRKVRLGQEASDVYVVESGLDGGEKVVRMGSFLLKTEILKGSIGAGCTCVEGK